MKAGSSANGNYLIVRNEKLEPGTKIAPGQPYKVRQIELQIYPKEKFINLKDRLVSESTFWTDLTVQWGVTFDLQKMPSVSPCSYFLITNDGEFLVIFERNGFRIHRRRDHLGDPMRKGPDRGVFIREVQLKELWPAERFQQWPRQSLTDDSPQWFAEGRFEFSKDSRELIYSTQSSKAVRVRLKDGLVEK